MESTKKSTVTSSMVDLKAELFRKQEEFKRQKAAGSSFVKGIKPEKSTKGSVWSKKNAGVLSRIKKDMDTKDDDDDIHAKSMKVLQEKARLYDKLCNSSTIPDEDGSDYYLVDFQKKVIDSVVEEREARRRKENEEEEESEKRALAAEIPEPADSDEEWIDFKDTFGRDRRCMKKDMDQLMKQDKEMALAQSHRKTERRAEEGSGQLPNLLSTDMHREMMREKWENEMKELQEKGQQDIHYSNIRFDEIRTHGVGFFQFSKDHEKREEQLEDIKKMREETLDEHSRKDRIKDKRKAMMEARLAKVRQRRNIKEPPADVKSESNLESEAVGPKLSEASLNPTTEDLIKKIEMEKQAEEKRKAHIREWDKDKQKDLPSKKNYIETLRDEREQEFAPPSAYFEEPKGRSYQASNSSHVKRLQALSKTSHPASCNKELLASSGVHIVENKAHRNTQACSKPSITLETIKSETPAELQETKSSSTTHEQGHMNANSYAGNILETAANIHEAGLPSTPQEPHHTNTVMYSSTTQIGPYAGYQNLHYNYYDPTVQATQFHQNQLQVGSSGPQYHGGYAQHYHIPQQQQYFHQQQLTTQYLSNPVPQQQYNYYPGVNNQQLSGEALGNASFSNSRSTSVLDNSGTTSATSHFASTSDPIKIVADSTISEPKRSKIPKMAIMDTRYVKNLEVASVEILSVNPTTVTAIPYTPGSFTAAKQFTVKQYEDSVAESRIRNQISGTPVLYTAEQLKIQKQLQHSSEDNKQVATGPEADKKIQDFLSSIQANKNL